MSLLGTHPRFNPLTPILKLLLFLSTTILHLSRLSLDCFPLLHLHSYPDSQAPIVTVTATKELLSSS